MRGQFSTQAHIGWGYRLTVIAFAIWARDTKFVGVPQSKLKHGFHQIFRICLTQEDPEVMRIWRVYLANAVTMAMFFYFFSVLNCVSVPKPKPMHGFSPSFLYMFNTGRSRAD